MDNFKDHDNRHSTAMDLLRCHAPASITKPHAVYILTDLTRSGIGYYSRIFVPGIVGGDAAIVELTRAIAVVTGHQAKERGASLWLYSRGTFDYQAAALLLAQAMGIPAEDQHRAYTVKPL